MKRLITLVLLLGILLSLEGFNFTEKHSDFDSIETYKDIPNITKEECSAIETLKKENSSFSYGHLINTETFPLPDGTYAGFTIKVCHLLSKLFGIKFTNTPYDNWTQLKIDMDNQTIDFMGGLTQTPSRIKDYHMTHPIANRLLRLYTLAGNDEIEQESDINGHKIGFLNGTINSEYIVQFYPSLQFQTCTVDSIATAAQKLRTGELDAFVGDAVLDPSFEPYDYIHSKKFFSLVYTPVSLSTANDKLAPIISAMNKYLMAGGIDKLYTLYQEGEHEYAINKLEKTYTSEEKDYLKNLKNQGIKIKAALEYDNYPISFYNEKENEFQGVAIDILNEISSLTSIEFQSATTKDTSWKEVLEKLKSGELSLVTELFFSETRKNDYIWTKHPYFFSHYALLSKTEYQNLTPPQIFRARVGVMSNSMYETMYHKWFPLSENLTRYSTQQNALEALENDEIDLLMSSEVMLLTQTNYKENSRYKINMDFDTPIHSMFGLNKDEKLLCSIIDKAQPFVHTKNIADNWSKRVFDYSSKLASVRTLYLTIFLISLIFILIFVTWLLFKNKKISRHLERQTLTLSTIYNNMPDLVFIKDSNSLYTSCNPSFEAFAGCSKKDIIGKGDIEIFSIDKQMAIRFTESDQKTLNETVTNKIEEWVTYPDNSHKLLETIKTPLIQNGVVVGLLGICRDITEHKAIEDAALIASKAKSLFLAHMSHEIRTPLNAIIGMTSIAKNSILDQGKTLSSIMQIKYSSQYLLEIINDVLDMSKIESGRLELTLAPFSLLSSCKEVSEIIMQRCNEKDIIFNNNFGELRNLILLGDKTRLNQVLINLLGNAVKFTDPFGDITFSIYVLEEDEKHIQLEYSIIDTGIGMTKEQIKKLFIPFEQGDYSISSRYGGTGLGLSISKSIITMMGGDIHVESTLDVGTKFYFTLDFEKVKDMITSSTIRQDDFNLNDKRILIVEDLYINRTIVSEILSPTGVETEEAENGKQALDMFGNSSLGYYDIILMDIQMPIMNGYDATKKIRALERADAKTVKIIALTANAYKEDVTSALLAGMNSHLAKPIEPKLLLETLQNILK